MKFTTILPTLAVVLPGLITAHPTSEPSANICLLNAPLLRRVPADGSHLYPGGLGDPLNGGFRSRTPSKVTKQENWTKTIPKNCKVEAQKDNRCSMQDMEVTEVRYADSDPNHHWILCRCKKNAKVSRKDLIAHVGRVPPGMRQHTRNFMAFNVGIGAYASFQSGDIVFLGEVNPTIVFHEVSHTVDRGVRSASAEWKKAIQEDSCWADYYAQTTEVEAWAQTNVIVRYKREFGYLPRGNFGKDMTEDCMAHQMSVVEQQTDAEIARGYDSSIAREKDTETNRL